MYYTIYKISNKINGKIYIGSHKTKNLDDGYMGSGKYLKHAQEKYGMENFKKEILFVYDNPEEMYAKEAELVNEEFISEENTYNIKVGGFGGFDYINSVMSDEERFKISSLGGLTRHISEEEMSRRISEGIMDSDKKFNGTLSVSQKYPKSPFYGKRHSDSTKKKIGMSVSNKQMKEKNSQYGTIWITNGSENKKIKDLSQIPEGWYRGRKITL
jgi:hypothetical protein